MSTFDEKEFSVLPNDPAIGNLLTAINDLKETLKSSEIKSRKNENESEDDFIIRTALSSIDIGRALFRKNKKAEETKVVAWLSIAKEKAERTALLEGIKYKEKLTPDGLREVAKLCITPDNVISLTDYLKEKHGIILVIEKSFKSMKMDGCTFRLGNGVPVVGLSIRYNRYDNFWFTLMHELSHVCLHYDSLDSPIIDDLEASEESDIEDAANRLASDSLVPRSDWRKIVNAIDNYEGFLGACARAMVHPAIAAGMVRHKTGNYKLFPKEHHVMDMKKTLGIEND